VTRSSLLIVVALLWAGVRVARADGEAGEGSGAAAAAGSGAEHHEAGGDELAIGDRPLTAKTGAITVDGVFPFFNSGAGSASTFAIAAALSGTYSISDQLQVGGIYGFFLDSFDATPTLSAHVDYLAYHTDKLDVAVSALLGIDTHNNGDVVVDIGAWARYKLLDKLWLFTGQPADIPITGGGVGAFVFGPNAYQVTALLNNSNAFLITLPVGAAYQLAPNIWGYVQTEIADFLVNNGGNTAFIFADFIPITIGGFYSLPAPKLDIGLSFGDELKNAGDTYAFTVNVRYFIK
jgi:hypothetical protein